MMAEFWGFDQVDVDGLVFTSYNSLDWKDVSPIALELRKLGVPVWYDYGLKANTEAWYEQISIHIEKASALVIFITKGIFEREKSYVIEEYREAEKLDIPIVPVFLDDVVKKDYFRRIPAKYRKFVNEWEDCQGVANDTVSRNSIAGTAAEIKHVLDHSGIRYPNTPFVDTQAEMKRKAEEAKAKAEREAQAEKARKEAEEKARAQAKPTVKVGSRVQFGSYPQSTNDPEPIMWRVLDVIDGKALMISEDLLDAHRFDASSNDWQKSELRAWLNKDFINKAFSAAEQRQLGSVAGDKVTCLSIDEVKSYFNDTTQKQKGYMTYPDRMAKPTAYARKNGAYVDSDFSTGVWWLRSPGSSSGRAAYVNSDGGIVDFVDGYVNYDGRLGRPVVLASL